MITSSMRSQPGIVSLNFDLANGVGPGIEKWRGSRYYLAIAYVLGGAVGPGACRTLFADFRGGQFAFFALIFLGGQAGFSTAAMARSPELARLFQQPDLENHWVPMRNRALPSVMAFVAQATHPAGALLRDRQPAA